MADDAGALLVRSGLVTSSALDDARARVASAGGTLGEQLVTSGAITDDALTEFYRARLLVPQVNPNLLARLTPQIVGMLPADMAIELRAIPVSLDADNNLTLAMSDPSDRHAVDEIAFFTGTYVVRAVATQMQIAWCLAHYYGHVTALGHRLLHSAERGSPLKVALSPAPRPPRAKGLTGKVNATRHRAVAPITGPVDVARPTSGQLDLRPLAAGAGEAPPGVAAEPGPRAAALPPNGRPVSAAIAPTPVPVLPPAGAPTGTLRSAPLASPPPAPVSSTSPRAGAPSSTLPGAPMPIATAPRGSGPATAPLDAVVARATPDAPPPPPAPPPASSEPAASVANPVVVEVERADAGGESTPGVPGDAVPERPRTRSVSGEIRVPVRRAPSIRPPLPEPEDDEPLIVIEADAADEATAHVPRRRAVKSDPPELYARAGEVDLKQTSDRAITEEPRIVIDEDALAPPTARIDTRRARLDDDAPITAIDITDDADSGAVIHDRIVERESQPILLDRPRATPDPMQTSAATAGPADVEDADTGEIDIVVLDARKKRSERRTVVGVPPVPVPVRPPHEPRVSAAHRAVDGAAEDSEPTKPDLRAAPGDDATPDRLAAPPAPASEANTHPLIVAPPRRPASPRTSATQLAAVLDEDEDEDDDDDDDDDGRDGDDDEAIPEETSQLDLARRSRHRIDHDAVDDGWGPPGTTIPPPLLGAIPGNDDDEPISTIPMPDVDSSPLIVGLPSLASRDGGGRSLAQTVEEATARAIEVIRQLERATSRDEVVHLMIAYLAETHHRAGFFVTRHAASRGASELSVFAMMPRPAVLPFATIRLDRPSTLQDVVGTRLPYRGPMHDDASRGFLIAALGACPAEILLVPVAVRERVVGVLFGEHRKRHTFDDQLALAARAAGMALERILRARRP